MHLLNKIVAVHRPLANALLDRAGNGAVCIFCQHRPTIARRDYIFTSRRLASVETKDARDASDVAANQLPDDDPVSAREPEFDFEIDPLADANEMATGRERMVNRRSETKRLKKKAEMQERAAQREAQLQIERTQELIKDNPFAAGYKPAETWNGLQRLGGDEKRVSTTPFKNFYSPQTVKGGPQITIATYRAAVETLAAISAGADPTIASTYVVGNPMGAVKHVGVVVKDGDVQLSFPDEQTERGVLNAGYPWQLKAAPGEEVMPEADERSTKRMTEIINGWGSDWRQISLENPDFKLAFIKRLGRLLGHPISDFTIHNSRTIEALLSVIVKPPPPATVFESLKRQSFGQTTPVDDSSATARLLRLPNVRVRDRRETMIHKEWALGRWKVIKQELRRRGLPVPGRRRRSSRQRPATETAQ